MKFKINHVTTYKFDAAVFLEPHYLRFEPRSTPFIVVSDFSLEILPKPVGHKKLQDEENNSSDFYWFEDLTKSMTIKSSSTLEIKPYNPFDFIVYPQQFNQVPFEYDKLRQKLLFASLEKQIISQKLINYGSHIAKEAQFNTLQFLTSLTSQIHADFTVEYREVGPPLKADKTFKLKRGSCRDLSWMLIGILRQMGIAARFVSGYYYFDMEESAFELHAWVDVYLPGTGWLGIDPSHGILVGNTHFPIASSAFFENTMPVSGGIRGDASSTLVTELSIKKII